MGGPYKKTVKGKEISSEDVQTHRGAGNRAAKHTRAPQGSSSHFIPTESSYLLSKALLGHQVIYATTAPSSGVVEFCFFYDLVRIIQEQLCIDKILGNKFR